MMLNIPGYEITGLIHQNPATALFRGRRIAGGKPVIIKMPAAPYPSERDMALLYREFEITAQLDLDGVMKPLALEKHHSLPVLVFEDPAGLSLEEYRSGNNIGLPAFLDIALQLSGILEKIHLNLLVH
ncbi:serine/threonine-protein kinase, partial [Desulfocucumis palustris]|uniref:serine/threonine-protein kinase n=1 Tax=Desulfocucumis palustris TaxID=1898651 RepID=UPI000FFE6D46